MAIDYCNDDPLGPSEVVFCPADDKVGGYNAAVFLEKNSGVSDPSNAGQINAAIGNTKAHLVKRISMWIDAPTGVEQDSLVPCETPTLVNYDRKGGYINPNVTANNVPFHDNLFDGRSFGDGVILANCGKDGTVQQVYWVRGAIKLKGGFIGPQKNTDLARFEGEWASKGMRNPTIHQVPVGVFD